MNNEKNKSGVIIWQLYERKNIATQYFQIL